MDDTGKEFSKAVESEELNWRLRVFDSLSYPTMIIKPDYTLVNANQKFLQLFGKHPEQIRGEKCYAFFYNKETPCPADECPVMQLLKTRQGQTFPWRKQGRWEDRVFSPILDDQGEVAYIIESIRDVTHVKMLEIELSGIKELISRVVHSSASAIVAADRKGNIQLMNRAARELLGVTDVYERTIYNAEQLYPPGKAKEIMGMLRNERMGGKGKLSGVPVTILDVFGQEIPVEMSAAIIYDDEDKESATMAIYNDLRKKLEIEKQLQETQKQLAQSEKMASLGQLAAGVAHEINNPLTGILMYASMMLEQLDPGSPQRQDIEFVIEDVNRCKEIVKSLLAYSRSTDFQRNIIDVNQLVEQSFRLARDQKVFRNIHIEKQLSDEMMRINVDSNKLSQVIINLVMNAADAMDGKGTLTVRTYLDKAAKEVYLAVSDTGCGIPDDHLSKIFDPFFSSKSRDKNTGLGLSIAYGIVEEHEGQIYVSHTGPEGTTFIVKLPQYIPEKDQGQT